MIVKGIGIPQAAKAMDVEVTELNEMLDRCGIHAQDGLLSAGEVKALMGYLEAQREQAVRHAQENLTMLVQRYALLIDTCSLLNEKFPVLMTHLIPLLRAEGKALNIPSGVIAELQSLTQTKPELRAPIATLIRQLAALRQEGLVNVYGGHTETFSDKQLLTVANHFRTSTELLVITQDLNLSEDLMRLNELSSVQGKRLTVGRVNHYGYLSRYIPKAEQRLASAPRCDSSSQPQTLVAEDSTPIPARSLREGDTVRCDGGVMRLGARLASGGEGVIHDLGDGSVAKVYHADKLTVGKRDKLEQMVAMGLDQPGLCWPQALLYDDGGNFVGYRMRKARGWQLQESLFTRAAQERCFPSWQKADMVRLCVTILEKICALHSRGAILGDINPQNIMVASPEEVWFVDCDSYQVAGYPCPVGTVRFTPPEIQGKNYATFLRTPGNEAFAVATLLFMLMLPGKSPYAQRDGGSLTEAIRAMDFPYPCGENHSKNPPEGDWLYLWSHLPLYLKKLFFETFQKGGRYSQEHSRLSAEAWLSAFNRYHELLASGKLQDKDPQSGWIYPNRFKIADASMQSVAESRTCVECGASFDILDTERRHFIQLGMQLPRRCPTCRRLRKLMSTSGYDGSAA